MTCYVPFKSIEDMEQFVTGGVPKKYMLKDLSDALHWACFDKKTGNMLDELYYLGLKGPAICFVWFMVGAGLTPLYYPDMKKIVIAR